MEHQETLETSTGVSELANTIKNEINNLLSGRVVTTGVVVGSILLSVDNLLGMVEVLEGTGANLVTHSGLEIDIDGAGRVVSGRRLAEEGVEGVVRNAQTFVGGHGSIRFNAVLKTVQLPALVTGLYTGLTQMNRDTLCSSSRGSCRHGLGETTGIRLLSETLQSFKAAPD